MDKYVTEYELDLFRMHKILLKTQWTRSQIPDNIYQNRASSKLNTLKLSSSTGYICMVPNTNSETFKRNFKKEEKKTKNKTIRGQNWTEKKIRNHKL